MNRGVILGIQLQEIGLTLQRLSIEGFDVKHDLQAPLTDVIAWQELHDVMIDVKTIYEHLENAVHPKDT